ncbi:MAG: hypothetical protein ACQEUK_06315 [Pseudomonadota bacterium]
MQIELEIGDRVDHRAFGLGTVLDVSVPGISFIPPQNSKGPVCQVSVQWDSPDQQDNTLMSWALKKMSSPDQRPYLYWEKQWIPLREEWLKARKDVERSCSTFSPPPNDEKLSAALLREKLAFEALETFWKKAEQRGKT